MLSDDELRRRLIAGRNLRGYTQQELAAILVRDGLGKHDLGRIERGTMAMQRIHRDAFARHLRLPERWFTEPDVDIIVGLRQPLEAGATRVLLERLLADLDQAETQAPPGTLPRPGGEGHPQANEGGGGA